MSTPVAGKEGPYRRAKNEAAKQVNFAVNSVKVKLPLQQNESALSLPSAATQPLLRQQKTFESPCGESTTSSNLDPVAPTLARFCKKCGNKYIADAQFCRKCGAQRPGTTPVDGQNSKPDYQVANLIPDLDCVCKFCGNVLAYEGKYCRRCGEERHKIKKLHIGKPPPCTEGQLVTRAELGSMTTLVELEEAGLLDARLTAWYRDMLQPSPMNDFAPRTSSRRRFKSKHSFRKVSSRKASDKTFWEGRDAEKLSIWDLCDLVQNSDFRFLREFEGDESCEVPDDNSDRTSQPRQSVQVDRPASSEAVISPSYAAAGTWEHARYLISGSWKASGGLGSLLNPQVQLQTQLRIFMRAELEVTACVYDEMLELRVLKNCVWHVPAEDIRPPISIPYSDEWEDELSRQAKKVGSRRCFDRNGREIALYEAGDRIRIDTRRHEDFRSGSSPELFPLMLKVVARNSRQVEVMALRGMPGSRVAVLGCELPPGEIINIVVAYGKATEIQATDNKLSYSGAIEAEAAPPRSFQLRIIVSSNLDRGPILLRATAASKSGPRHDDLMEERPKVAATILSTQEGGVEPNLEDAEVTLSPAEIAAAAAASIGENPSSAGPTTRKAGPLLDSDMDVDANIYDSLGNCAVQIRMRSRKVLTAATAALTRNIRSI
jgi:hypothetical protein